MYVYVSRMDSKPQPQRVTLADQVWVATALLEQANASRDGFRKQEIRDAVAKEFGSASSGVGTHISNHCVASVQPSSSIRHRMLTRARHGVYRLFRPGDLEHAGREGEKMTPARADLPAKYHALLDWYERGAPANARQGRGRGRMTARYLAEATAVYEPTLTTTYRVFGPDATLLRVQPGESGLHDVGERHDHYLVEAWLEEHGRTGA